MVGAERGRRIYRVPVPENSLEKASDEQRPGESQPRDQAQDARCGPVSQRGLVSTTGLSGVAGDSRGVDHRKNLSGYDPGIKPGERRDLLTEYFTEKKLRRRRPL